MSQLNLQQILSGDDLSVVVDKLNYNFNQILLNGGGPQGLQGIIGAPGLPGAQGIQGVTGPSGEEGTHIYVSGATPGIYPFGTGGEILPRIGDVYVETDPTFLNIYQLSVTGGTGSYWNLVDTITPPGNSLSKLVVDQVLGASATWTNAANDPSISGKFLFGSPDALYSSYIIDPAFPITSANPTLRVEMSSVALYGDSLVTFASDKNQLRLMDYTRADATRLQDGGGIAHSVETMSGNQYYRIVNADLQGSNRFYLSLNGGLSIPSLIYGDTTNRIGFGVADATPLVANATVNGSIAIGRLSTSFYLASAGATLSGGIGAVIEGNVAVGRNNNNNYTLGAYNRPGQFGSSLILDTSIGNTTGAVSTLTLGGGVYDLANGISSTPNNLWRFTANYDSTVTNAENRTLRLHTTQYFSSAYQSRDAMTFGLTGALGVTATQISVDSKTLYGKFEIGDQTHNKISIGNAQGLISSGFMNSHIGFNLSRSPVSSAWRRGGDGANNAGKVIWSSNSRGLGFSFFGSTGGETATTTDGGVFNSTRIYMSLTGAIATSDYTNAAELEILGYSLHIDSAATGTTGQGATSGGVFRRLVATFGDGAQSSKSGSPLIASTNGISQSISSGINVGATGVTAQVVPHYTWYGDDLYGLYLSEGTVVNGAAGSSVGIAVGGSAGITLTGMFNTERRLGIDQENPLSKMHVGTKFTYNENSVFVGPGPAGVGSVTTNFIGYNTYYNLAASQIRRIAGSTASGATQQGGFDMRFIENNIVDPFDPVTTQGLTGYSSMGTKLALIPHGPGGIFSNLTNPAGVSYRGMIISPPATGPTAGGWINYSANTPRVSIGLNDSTITTERDSQYSLRRGTLSIAAQTRIKPATAALPASGPFGLTVEDQYNIGLYSYDSLPVAGVFGAGGNSSTTLKSFGINFLGTGGNAIADDIPLLFATTSKGLTQTFSRIANFGAGFRLGVNIVPANQPQVYASATDPIYDFASLVVGAYTEGLTGSALQQAPTAIISKGVLVVDQSTYGGGNGANQGIYFKDNSINWSGAPPRPNVNNYITDWGIQYWSAGATETGLNFWKPFNSLGSFSGSAIMYLSDNGFVGVRTTLRRQLGATMSAFNVGGSAYVDGSVGIGTTQLTYSSSPATGGGLHIPGFTNWTSFSGPNEVKLAVDGGIKSNYIINISDRRVKDNISPLICDSETFMKLNPVSFTMKDNSGIHFGFIAQDVQETHPEIIRIFEDEELEGGRMAIDYNSIIAILTKQVQGQQKTIEEKDKKIAELENRMKIIEEKLGL